MTRPSVLRTGTCLPGTVKRSTGLPPDRGYCGDTPVTRSAHRDKDHKVTSGTRLTRPKSNTRPPLPRQTLATAHAVPGARRAVRGTGHRAGAPRDGRVPGTSTVGRRIHVGFAVEESTPTPRLTRTGTHRTRYGLPSPGIRDTPPLPSGEDYKGSPL